MAHLVLRALLLWAVLAVTACATRAPDRPLDAISEEYVKLALAVGRHDDNFVDAYYGPVEWKEDAGRGDPVPVSELLPRVRELRARVLEAEPSPRRDYLDKQLRAVDGFLRRLAGESLTLAEEARLLGAPTTGTRGTCTA